MTGPELPALLAGLGVGLVALGLGRRGRSAALEDVEGPGEAWGPAAGAPLLVRLGAIVTRRIESHSEILRRAARRQSARRAALERQLNQAGRPWGLSAEDLQAISLLGGLGTGVAGVVVAALLGMPWLIGVVLGAVVGLYPRAALSRMARERSWQIRRAIPAMLDLLVLSAESGGTPRAGLALVAKHLGGPLGAEVAAVERRIGVGVDEETALVELANRVGLPELEEMAMNIVSAVRFGTLQYHEVLEAQAQRARLAQKQEVERMIHVLSVKLLLPMVVFFLPAMLIVFLGPSMITFTRSI